ncbi:MAG: ATP-binding cassette domain-containing protein [Acetatifactor sp.]|nr:ATP-binding cassette domain-containing protein [Acetatifactor sp.]
MKNVMTMNVLEVQELTKIYYGEYQLNGISFSLGKGSALAVLGGKCAGKTPLLETITGRKRADSGAVLYKGNDIYTLGPENWKEIAFVPDDIIYYERKTVKRLLERTMRWHGTGTMEDAEEVCEMFHIDMDAELLALSDRDRKCVAIINGMVVRPQLLILDEMYHGLDEKTYLELLDLIDAMRRRGMTVIYACEEYEQISDYCDEYLLLQEGDCVASGHVKDVKQPGRMVSVMTEDWLRRGGKEATKLFLQFIAVCRKSEKIDDIRVLKSRVCFLYRGDMLELSRLLYAFHCKDYLVEELSWEEAVLHKYERWSE